MSTVASTDLILVERGGSLYKCLKSAYDAGGPVSADFFLVERTSALYKETYGIRANIDAGDLIVVERGTSLYKCAWSDWASTSGGGGGGAGAQLFTSVGTSVFTAPAGVTSVYIVCIGGGGGGPNPDPNIVAASAFNRGTGTDQVNQLTGLTYVEESLLKPWEKAYRIKQNQKRT